MKQQDNNNFTIYSNKIPRQHTVNSTIIKQTQYYTHHRKRMVVCVPNVPRSPDNTNNLFSTALHYLETAANDVGWDCFCIDAYYENLSTDKTVQKILDLAPFDILGFSIHSETMRNTCEDLLVQLDSWLPPSIPIIAGGVYASLRWHQLLSNFSRLSVAVIGEGEETIKDLLRHYKNGNSLKPLAGTAIRLENGKILKGTHRKKTKQLDELGEFPHYWVEKHINQKVVNISTSRGCSGNCAFCVVNPHFGKNSSWRGHSAKWIISRIHDIINVRKTEHIKINFVDDEFVGTSDSIVRAGDLCNMIKSQQLNVEFSFMCRADTVCKKPEIFQSLFSCGAKTIFIGIETANREQLKRWNKRITPELADNAVKILNEIGFSIQSGTIIFYPGTTLQDLIIDLTFFESLLNKYNGFCFSGLYSLDIMDKGSSCMLGQNKNGSEWYKKWHVDSKLQPVYEHWQLLRNKVFYPALSLLTNDERLSIKKNLAYWQIEVLRNLISEMALSRSVTNKWQEVSIVSMYNLLKQNISKDIAVAYLLKPFISSNKGEQERCFSEV